MVFCASACGLPCVNRKQGHDGEPVEGDYNEAPDGKPRATENFYAGDGSVDLKGRPVSKHNTGGWKTASLIFGAVMFESIASVGIAFTIFSYLSGQMHLSISGASIHTNIYWGTSFITSLLGGFVSDAYLGRFWTSIVSAIIELLGLGLILISVRVEGLRPNCVGLSCPSLVETGGFACFMIGLYLVALGAGCLRPCLITLGADQFDIEDPQEKKQIRSYFNWFFFAMSVGGMVAMMAVVYVADQVSWFWAYMIMAMAMLLAIGFLVAGAGYYRHKKPQGSPFTRIAQVIVAASRKKKIAPPSDSAMLFEVHDHENGTPTLATEPTLKRFNSIKGEVLGEPTLKRYYSLPHTKGLRFLDKAAILTETDTGTQSTTEINPWRLCTITQVEELKIMLRCFPITGVVAAVYIVVAQIQTWAVAQGFTMERTFGSFQFPPPSMSAISVAFVLVELAVYDRWIVPLVRKYTNHSHGITHLQRIGIGLVQSILAMAYGAILETERLRLARKHGLTDNPMAVVPMSIFWLLPMWILASSSELFAYVGCFEFFWQEMPVELRSLGGGLSLHAVAMGFYQSGGVLGITNLATKSSNGGWLADENLNKNKLNYYYIVVMVVTILNSFGFLMLTRWYNYVKFINTKDSDRTVATSPLPHIFQRSESRVPLNQPSLPAEREAASPDLKTKPDVEEKYPTASEGDENLPRSESKTPLRSPDASNGMSTPEVTLSTSTPTPPSRSPRNIGNIFSHVFAPRNVETASVATQSADPSSPKFFKLNRSRAHSQ